MLKVVDKEGEKKRKLEDRQFWIMGLENTAKSTMDFKRNESINPASFFLFLFFLEQ